jgi:REP element-mobilizing transposase RayT
MMTYPKYGKPFEPGKFYHIYNCAVGMEKLFVRSDNYRYFLEKFQFYTKNILKVYAYCLIPNHFHFLIKVNDDADRKIVSNQFRKFFISYSKSFNLQQSRSGTLFSKHLKRVEISSDSQLVWTVYYIHRNPVHHFITRDYKKYIWSSYSAILSSKPTRVERDDFLKIFNGKAIQTWYVWANWIRNCDPFGDLTAKPSSNLNKHTMSYRCVEPHPHSRVTETWYVWTI